MKEYDPIILGKQIYKYRTLQKFSQKELATRAGVAPSYLSDLEGGIKSKNGNINLDKLSNLAKALNVTIDDFASENLEKYNCDSHNNLKEIENELATMQIPDLVLFDKLIDAIVKTYNSKE